MQVIQTQQVHSNFDIQLAKHRARLININKPFLIDSAYESTWLSYRKPSKNMTYRAILGHYYYWIEMSGIEIE